MGGCNVQREALHVPNMLMHSCTDNTNRTKGSKHRSQAPLLARQTTVRLSLVRVLWLVAGDVLVLINLCDY